MEKDKLNNKMVISGKNPNTYGFFIIAPLTVVFTP
jgi:hypothetical protein